jgi:glutathione S-transferase
MKLYQYPLSPNCQKVVALAHEVGIPLETVRVDIFKGEARAAALLAKNPNGRVPVLEDGDFILWESTAMLGYLAAKAGRADLAPSAPREHADVERWLAWYGAHFGPAMRKIAFERVAKKLGGLGAPDEAIVQQGLAEFAVVAQVLDRALAGREYLCGELTIADFCFAPHIALTDSCGIDLQPYPHVYAWRERMVTRDSVRKTFAAASRAQ